jgi:polyphosphate kinase
MHEAVVGMIEREIEHAKNGRPAGISAKINSLVDADVVNALYRASAAGVSVSLLLRRTCCLRAGAKRWGERIVVRSIVDRFLEHARVVHFTNGGDDEVYLTSADWMPRNFRRRVEVMCPILDATLKRRIIDEILHVAASDNVKAWHQQPDGSYVRPLREPGAPLIRAQHRFIEQARERAHRADPVPRSLLIATSAQPTLQELRHRPRKKRRRAVRSKE